MTAKYSTDREDLSGRRWQSDRQHVVATWIDKPFLDINRRYDRERRYRPSSHPRRRSV